MYETRQQASLHQDENKRGDLKAAKASVFAGNGKSFPAGNNTRRALGDIGNVVGSAALRSNTSKDGQADGLNPKAGPVVERPITRSFGAKLANNNQASEHAVVQPKKEDAEDEAAVGNRQRRGSKKQDECTEGDCKASTDMPPGHPARMKALLNGRNGKVAAGNNRRGRTLTATLTARSEAASGGFKAEVEEEAVPNIDAGDVGNQLAVVDYVEDIYSFYRKTECQSCVDPNYMSKQAHITDKMRAILIDWLIEVHLKFKLMPETLFLTSNVIDRYLAVQSVERRNLQLVGMTAMLVASKYEEIWAPEIQEFIVISDNAYTREHILDMEKHMLNTLRFNFCVPTPYMFLVRFLKAASSNQQMNMLAFYFVELCLVDYRMVKFTPSMLAASAVYLARCMVKVDEGVCWNATLRRYSCYNEKQLKDCVLLMVSLHQKAGEGTSKVVFRKYSHDKFGSVALLSPPSTISTTLEEASDESGQTHA